MKLLPQVKRLLYEAWLLKNYVTLKQEEPAKSEIVVMLHAERLHGGLVDRLKGIVSSYAIAKELGYPFKICISEQKFLLSKYLLPNSGTTYCTKQSLQRSFLNARPIYLYNFFHYSRMQLLDIFRSSKKQFHVYTNVDYLPALNTVKPHAENCDEWRKLFFELFRFADDFEVYFKKQFDNASPICGIHLRFHSLLGDFEEVNIISIPAEAQLMLMENCIQCIRQLITENSESQFLIVSDSNRFLQMLCKLNIQHSKKIVILDGSIAHLDVDHREEVLEKTILDFFLLHKCQQVYQVLGPKMHNSQFSKYAATLGGGNYILKRI